MTRIRRARVVPFEDVEFDLTFGPQVRNQFTIDELAVAWSASETKLMAEWPRNTPGHRPWAFWQFTVGEHPKGKEDQVLLLAELGLLYDEELAALRERRRWRDINSGIEHTDQAAVELYERVCKARGARTIDPVAA